MEAMYICNKWGPSNLWYQSYLLLSVDNKPLDGMIDQSELSIPESNVINE